MTYIITIEESDKGVKVTVQKPGNEDDRSATKLMFELILDAVNAHFKPLWTYFVPRRVKR